MKNFKYIPGENDNSLDEYFKAFAGQKVNLTSESVRSLLASHSTAGFFGSLFSKLAFKSLIAFTGLAIVATSVIFLTESHKTGLKPSEAKNDFPVVSSFSKDEFAELNPSEVNQFTQSRLSRQNGRISAEPAAEPISNEVADEPGSEGNSRNEITVQLSSGFNHPVRLLSTVPEMQTFGSPAYSSVTYENEETSTLFNNYIKKSSLWIAPVAKATGLKGVFGFLKGAKAGFIMNDNLGIGLFAYTVGNGGNASMPNGVNSKTGDLSLLYGGVFVEYTLLPQQTFHYFVNVSVSGGGYGVSQSGTPDYSRPFAVIEPGAGIEFSVNKFFRVAAEAQYKISSDVKFSENQVSGNLNSMLTSNLSLSLMMKIGIF